MEPNVDDSTNGKNPFADLQGFWRCHNYGLLLHIQDNGYDLYEETAVSRLPVYSGSHETLADFYVDITISGKHQSFSARRATGVTRVTYRRLKHAPEVSSKSRTRDPLYNFDVFCHLFHERYALFDIRNINWQTLCDTHRPLINTSMNDAELFGTFINMMAPLRDGHVELHASCGAYNAGAMLPLYQRLAGELEEPDNIHALTTLLEERKIHRRSIIREYYLAANRQSGANDLIEWGSVHESCAYIALHAMAGHAGKKNQPRADQLAAARGMERALQDIGHLPHLIIDLRTNSGGYDGVALRLAGYLIDRKRMAFSKAARNGQRFGGKQHVTIEPRGHEHYNGRLYLLTSGLTASAAEIFVLALLQHPRLQRIGEATQGILSDVMERHLPNGWRLTLSNELYSAADGTIYEDSGISPHIPIDYLTRQASDLGQDPMLDRVLQLISA